MPQLTVDVSPIMERMALQLAEKADEMTKVFADFAARMRQIADAMPEDDMEDE